MGSGLYHHHEAKYNLEKIFYNLLLVQDHLAFDPCANCLTKHISTILAYSDEGIQLDNADEVIPDFTKVNEVMPAVLAIIRGCANGDKCEIRNADDMYKLLQSIRTLRREIGRTLYGIDSDVVHDITDEKSHEETHEHEHIELPDYAHE